MSAPHRRDERDRLFHLRQIHCDCTAIQLGDVLSDAQNAKMALIAEP